MDQLDIFELMYDKVKIQKPIRLIEFFAGYGSQALALKYLGANFEHWKIAEWNYKSSFAYKSIHFPDDKTDYSKGLDKSSLVDFLFNKGISSDWNESMSRTQIERFPEWELRRIYNSIIATHNLVNVSQIRGGGFRNTRSR